MGSTPSPNYPDAAASKVLELPRRQAVLPPEAIESARDHLSEERVFRLQVQLDMQRERELLYKVLLVVEVIAALMLAREWVLWLFF